MDSPFQLCELLCGDFCNREQAFNNPPIYAHIKVRIRALSHLEPGSLLLEQAYTVAPNEPYRLRVLQVVVEAGQLKILNKGLRNESSFYGATGSADRLLKVTATDLKLLAGCTYNVSAEASGYKGVIEPGCKCLVERNGVSTYLVSHFLISSIGMTTLDRGYNIETNEMAWGSLAGPFEFKRHENSVAPPPNQWRKAWELN